MPDQNPVETGACAFCYREATRSSLLFEGDNFYVIADHAPIADAHLLLIPYEHYPHLAALPTSLHDEFELLKARLGDFVQQNYGALTYWENGVFGQSVPHAHLHTISLSLDPAVYVDHGHDFSGIAGLQERHAVNGGHYFMIERPGHARMLPPDPELYIRIIRHGQSISPTRWLPSRDERRNRGVVLIEALKQRWLEHNRSNGSK
jgi:diadenosine tetraphosphate (Ap4A) HIT family hydrolase